MHESALAIRLLDLVLVGSLGDAQYLVVVLSFALFELEFGLLDQLRVLFRLLQLVHLLVLEYGLLVLFGVRVAFGATQVRFDVAFVELDRSRAIANALIQLVQLTNNNTTQHTCEMLKLINMICKIIHFLKMLLQNVYF